MPNALFFISPTSPPLSRRLSVDDTEVEDTNLGRKPVQSSFAASSAVPPRNVFSRFLFLGPAIAFQTPHPHFLPPPTTFFLLQVPFFSWYPPFLELALLLLRRGAVSGLLGSILAQWHVVRAAFFFNVGPFGFRPKLISSSFF